MGWSCQYSQTPAITSSRDHNTRSEEKGNRLDKDAPDGDLTRPCFLRSLCLYLSLILYLLLSFSRSLSLSFSFSRSFSFSLSLSLEKKLRLMLESLAFAP